MAQEDRALCLNRNVCPRLRMSVGSGGIYVGLQIIGIILPCHPILQMRKLRPRCRI